MIDHVWSVLCTKSVIDKDSNLLTLMDIVDQVTVDVSGGVVELTPEGPVVRSVSELPNETALIPVNVELVSLWIRHDPDQAESGLARFMWVPPNEPAHIVGGPFAVDLSGDFNRMRTRVRISGVPAREGGKHVIAVEFQQQGSENWEPVAKVPLDIVFKTPESDDPPPE